MSNKEKLEQKYKETFDEEIVFDKLEQRGRFLIATKKEEKNRVHLGAGCVEHEKNSMTYYVVNTDDGSEAKMVIFSQDQVARKEDLGDNKETEIKIFSGKNIIANFDAFNVYIDTANKQEVCKVLTGGYPKAEYSANTPKIKKLWRAWYNSFLTDKEDNSIQERRFQEYHDEEIREIKNGLKTACQFFATFIGNKKDLKLAKEQSSDIKRITKFYKRLVGRELEPDKIITVYKGYRDIRY